MRKPCSLASALVAALLLAAICAAPVQAVPAQDWSFDNVGRIDIDGVSGDVIVRAGSGSSVRVVLEDTVSPDDSFQAEVDLSGSTLRVRERWGRGSSSGSVRWMLEVPAGADLEISVDTASGDLEASGVNARFDFSTASGDVVLSDMTLTSGSRFSTASGDLELTDVTVTDYVDMSTASGNVELTRVNASDRFSASTASGDVIIEGSQGELDASTASGNVRVRGNLTGPSEFSSASGDVDVVHEATVEHDIEASSASGDVTFEGTFGGNFTLVMTKRVDRGRIDSPFEATSQEEFERNGQTYVRQTVVRGSGDPEIRLDTASGSIRVRQR